MPTEKKDEREGKQQQQHQGKVFPALAEPIDEQKAKREKSKFLILSHIFGVFSLLLVLSLSARWLKLFSGAVIFCPSSSDCCDISRSIVGTLSCEFGWWAAALSSVEEQNESIKQSDWIAEREKVNKQRDANWFQLLLILAQAMRIGEIGSCGSYVTFEA